MSGRKYEHALKHIRFVTNKFDKWEIEFRDKRKIVGSKEFFEVSKMLCNLLPKVEDSTLFGSDHILYPGQEWTDNEESHSVIDPKELFDRINIATYLSAYYKELTENDKFHDILSDNTLIKVVKHLPKYYLDVYRIMEWLLNSKTEKHLCFGLKLLKIGLKGNFVQHFKSAETCLLVSSFIKGISTEISKDENNKKVALFIVNLAKECYAEFEEKCRFTNYVIPKYKPMAPIKKQFLEIFRDILLNHQITNYHQNFLYDTLASEKDDKIRRKYLKYILRAIICFSYPTPLESSFSVLIECLLKKIDNSSNIRSKGLDEEMRVIDKHFGCNIKSYLPDYVAIDPKKLLNDEVKAKDEKETDYTFKKFFFYDEVIKKLHLLLIFYTAYHMRNSLCKDEFIKEGNPEEFRKDNYLKDYIRFYLNNPDLLVPWYIEKTLQMCPFLIFPPKQKKLVIDLIKFLRGEKIPEMDKELSKKLWKCCKSLFKQDELLDHPKCPC